MTSPRILAVLLVLCTFTGSDRATAQELLRGAGEAEQGTTYLVPLLTRELPGANGSLWSTQWTVLNPRYGAQVTIAAPTCADAGQPCPETTIAPRMAVHPTLPPRADGGEGAFVHVPFDYTMNAAMSLRVRDLSKNAQSFGTGIPIVHATDYTRDDRPLIWLLDVPTDPQYRATLRIYGRGGYAALALVRIMVQPFASEAIEEHWLDLPAAGGNGDGEESGARLKYPSYVQFDPLTATVRAVAAGGRIAISVSAAQWDSTISPPPNVPIWAFLSVTDNSSQQVTIVTPHL